MKEELKEQCTYTWDQEEILSLILLQLKCVLSSLTYAHTRTHTRAHAQTHSAHAALAACAFRVKTVG